MPPSARNHSFADRLLTWWRFHGRHDLPWQVDRTPYRVWVAEIMLQQTRVVTVAEYFQRFTAQFPDLESLARAELDDVLSLWSGLGYYARARNLHRSARLCMARHGGQVPETPAALEDLPGIGRSTAHAIVAQAFDCRAPILDGNVKRVLARHAGIAGWPGRSAVLASLWDQADQRTPANHARDYTQAIMDLGATVCTPRKPDCRRCPVAGDCVAFNRDLLDQLPGRRPRKTRPRRHTVMFIVRDGRGRVLLQRRPPAGIWGGLWSLPESAQTARPAESNGRRVRHSFTHFELEIHLHHTDGLPADVADAADLQWFSPGDALTLGLPRPVRSVLESLHHPAPRPRAR